MWTIDGNLRYADANSDLWKVDSFCSSSTLRCPILEGNQPGNQAIRFGTSTIGYVDKGSDTRMIRRDRQKSIKDLPCALAEIEVADLVSPWIWGPG